MRTKRKKERWKEAENKNKIGKRNNNPYGKVSNMQMV